MYGINGEPLNILVVSFCIQQAQLLLQPCGLHKPDVNSELQQTASGQMIIPVTD